MNAEQMHKLVVQGLHRRVAQKLVQFGFPLPRNIKAATDEQLLALPSIKQDDVDDIRELFPRGD